MHVSWQCDIQFLLINLVSFLLRLGQVLDLGFFLGKGVWNKGGCLGLEGTGGGLIVHEHARRKRFLYYHRGGNGRWVYWVN